MSELALELSSDAGVASAMADLLERMRCGGDREDISAMTQERHIIAWFDERNQRKADMAAKKALARELQLTREAQATDTTTTRASFGEDLDLPRAGSPEPH